jgi:uncharacterized protein YdaU (DUF1376 family)
MPAPPYMKLYVADYLADTFHLTRDQHGAYLLLLMAMWRAGGRLPATDAKLAAIAKCTPKEWAANRDVLLGFFQRRGGLLTHKRLAAEMAKAEHVSEVRKGASEKGVAAKRSKNNDDGPPNGPPSADPKAAYIRYQSQKDNPPTPLPGGFDEKLFEESLSAYPTSGRSTTNRDKSAAAWAVEAAQAGEAGLACAVKAFAAFQAAEGARAKAPPAFHRWLAGKRYETFLPRPAQPSRTWGGPVEVWEAVVAERGEPFACSWLASCGWRDIPRAVVSESGLVISRLRQEVGPLLHDMGIELEERAA